MYLNFQKYAEVNPSKVTVKYIFTEENKEQKELDAFVENCIKYNLKIAIIKLV